MAKPSLRVIARSIRLPHTTGAARLRAEIIAAMYDLPPPDEQSPPQRVSHSPPMPDHALKRQPYRVLDRLRKGPLPTNEWRGLVGSQLSLRAAIAQLRRAGYSIMTANGEYSLVGSRPPD